MTQLVPLDQPDIPKKKKPWEALASRLGSFITHSLSFILGLIREYFQKNLNHCKSKLKAAPKERKNRRGKKYKSNTTRREGKIFPQATNSKAPRRIYDLVVKPTLLESRTHPGTS